jgi:tryptophan synthase alpha chain
LRLCVKKKKFMNRIDELFKKKKNNILNVYCTAGFPSADSTLQVMQALQDSGADMIELGMPYSDPLADGPVIQASSARAIANGMTLNKLFNDLQNFRSKINLPVILMGYMNPVIQYGFERFCERAKAVGIDGLILPDLPMYEYETEFGAIIKKYGLTFIFLVTPETSAERIKKLDELSSGFLYAVSSSSTTGNEKSFDQQVGYFKRLEEMQLKNPVLVGFGIKNKETFDTACRYANGAIIGTAYIRAVENASGKIETATKEFINGIIG